MCVCVCVCVCVCTCANTYQYVNVCVMQYFCGVHALVDISYACVCFRMCAYVCAYMYAYMYVYVCAHSCMHMCVHTCMGMCVHTYNVYGCVYVYATCYWTDSHTNVIGLSTMPLSSVVKSSVRIKEGLEASSSSSASSNSWEVKTNGRTSPFFCIPSPF